MKASRFIAADQPKSRADIIVLRSVATRRTGWAHVPRARRIAVDPELGRIAFPLAFSPDRRKRPCELPLRLQRRRWAAASTSAEVIRASRKSIQVTADGQPTIQAALATRTEPQPSARWRTQATDSSPQVDYPRRSGSTGCPAGTRYVAPADKRRRPIMSRRRMTITGGEGSEVTINGLLFEQRTDPRTSPTRAATRTSSRSCGLRHCTLAARAAAWRSRICSPERRRCRGSSSTLPNVVHRNRRLRSSARSRAVDGRARLPHRQHRGCGAETAAAYAGIGPGSRRAARDSSTSTVIGRVDTQMMSWRRTRSSLPAPGARARRRRCAPNGCNRAACGFVRAARLASAAPVRMPAARRRRTRRGCVRSSPRCVTAIAGYGQLGAHCSNEIRRGADDERRDGRLSRSISSRNVLPTCARGWTSICASVSRPGFLRPVDVTYSRLHILAL